MILVGSDDGVYRLDSIDNDPDAAASQVLESGRAPRVETFDGIDGAFAATASGLYHTDDGETWTDLAVPETEVYSVGASDDGTSLYAGTRSAHVFVTDSPTTPGEWTECEGFQDLPSREDWGLERHDYVSQVRDVHADPGGEDRIVAGVEVGGVHVSEDGGETWTERNEGVHDDVHELCVVDADEYAVGTGFGLFHSTDAGRTWIRLEEDYDQRYVRSVHDHEGVVYAGAALANSTTWDDPDADPQLFAFDGEELSTVDVPRPDETVTGMTNVNGTLIAGTHRGSILADDGDGFEVVGSFDVPAETIGRYSPLCWLA